MASQRSTALRLEKANLIARMEIQRGRVADAWEEAVLPFQAVERGMETAGKHPWVLGGVALAGSIALLVPGNFWFPRTALKIAAIAAPYLLALRNRGVVGFLLNVVKRLLFKLV